MTDHFEKEMVRESSHLKAFALRFTRCQHSAEDLMQETYLKAWKSRTDFRKGTSLRAWLFTIMKNTFINQYRSKHNTKRRKPELPMAEGAENLAPGILDVDHRMADKDLERAIRRLPRLFSAPLQLYMEGYRYQEISDVLQVPLGTIKCRIHFARKLVLRQVSL